MGIENSSGRTQAHPRHDPLLAKIQTHAQIPRRGNEVHRFAAFGLRAVEAVLTEPGHKADETTLEHEVNAEAGAGGCFPFETLSPDEIGLGNPSPTARFQLQRRHLSLALG